MGEIVATNKSIALAQLRPHPRNYNQHSPAQVKKIAASLKRFGQRKPITTWRNVVLTGHGVYEAAKLLKWDELWVAQCPEEWTEAEALAWLAADNELARQSEPDMAQLAAILEESLAADASLLEAIGYSEQEFDALLQEVRAGAGSDVQDAEPQIDRAEELRHKWGVESGQMWQLGEHRLICGDCTDAAVVARVMGREKAALCVTSPPYADLRMYDGSGDLSAETLVGFLDAPAALFVVNLGLILRDRQVVRYWDVYLDAADKRGLPLLAWNVWDKGNASAPAHQQAMFGLCHEWVFVFGSYRELRLTVENKRAGENNWGEPTVREKDGSLSWHSHSPVRTHRQLDSVLRLGALKNYHGDYTGHPAQFPLDFAVAYVDACSDKYAIVYEPFSGSGTTIMACEQLGRRCRAVEIAPGYVAVALERWATATGKTPVLVEG